MIPAGSPSAQVIHPYWITAPQTELFIGTNPDLGDASIKPSL